jgi:hypothetical protein
VFSKLPAGAPPYALFVEPVLNEAEGVGLRQSLFDNKWTSSSSSRLSPPSNSKLLGLISLIPFKARGEG